jgi:putative SOS response-associated peptidase YedK
MARTTQAERRPPNAHDFHAKRYWKATTAAGKFFALAGWVWALATKTGRRDEALSLLTTMVNEFGNGREIP